MKLILMTMMMLSLGLLTACGSSGGGGDPKVDPVPVVSNDLDALASVITADANENQIVALTIPEYKDTNSYAFTGVDGDSVELLSEDGLVVFKVEADFETQPVYNFIMTVTNAAGQTKDIDVTINIIDVQEDLNSLPSVITESVNENQFIALTIPEYKDTNSYAFTGVDGDRVELSSENGKVVFKIEADFETQPTYSFIMTVTNASDQTKDINVSINIIDIFEDLNSLPSVMTESVNENHRFAFTIPEYKDTNSYAFTGIDGDKVKLWPERGEVIFINAPDFETQPSYNLIMTVTNAIDQTKDINVAIDINNVTNDFIFEVEAGSIGSLNLRLNHDEQDDFQEFSFTIQKDNGPEISVEFSGNIDNQFVEIKPLNDDSDIVLLHKYTIKPKTDDGLPGFIFWPNDRAVKIRILQWGDNSWKSLHNMLQFACSGVNILSFDDAQGSPNLTSVNNMSNALHSCDFTENLAYWDVSSITDMSFSLARSKGEADLSQWDVSSVNNMEGMFAGAQKFNSDLSGWHVSAVENMRDMFSETVVFNTDISDWTVSAVENMEYMFGDSEVFDQNLKGWDVGRVTNCDFFKINSPLSNLYVPEFLCEINP